MYNPETGYGFISDSVLAPIRSVDRNGPDALCSDFCTSDKPFYFMIDLPEGNYKVIFTTGDAADFCQTTVKAELRRLMIEQERTAPGVFSVRRFMVNIRTPFISDSEMVQLKDREKTFEYWAWDDRLILEFNGERPVVCALEVIPVDNISVIYLLGNSTVCDQPFEPYSSWGQMLTRFFKPDVVIANHAESGESLQSAFARRRVDKIMSLMKSGDYLFLQFGHNDMKLRGEGIGPFTSFKSELFRVIDETRKHGGIPVLVTPMQRRNFNESGHVVNSHEDYPEAVRQAAREKNTPLIDLHQMSTQLYEALGSEGSVVLFSMPSDHTHHNNYGSYQLAKCVVEGIKSSNLAIAEYITEDFEDYNPSHPDPPETWKFPPSPVFSCKGSEDSSIH